jgi:TRAP transporter TAXI family solute receptor
MKIESKATFVRAALAWGLLIGLVVAVLLWFFAGDPRHQEITLVTGVEGGLYHQFGVELEKIYKRRSGRGMTVVATEGSTANRRALISGDAQVAIVQAGSVNLDGLDLFCSLYPEVIHVVVRNELPVRSIDELAGRKLVLGPLQSGMRKSGMEILKHHQISDQIVEETDRYFDEILNDEDIDGAVVTTGIFNPDLQRVLGTGHFRLLPIVSAGAIQARSAHLREYLLPMGVYGIHQGVPSEDLPTLSTTALLVGRRKLPPNLIRNSLEAVFEGGLHYRFPTLFRKDQMLGVGPGPLAEEADLFFNPADRIGQMANIMESIAAFKELAFRPH